jgi:hypothetical protein
MSPPIDKQAAKRIWTNANRTPRAWEPGDGAADTGSGES